MLARAILPYLFKIALLALIGLLCFGNIPAEDLLRVVGAFIAVRLALLVIEAFQRPIPEERWEELISKLTSDYENLPETDLQTHAKSLKLDSRPTSPADLARAEIALARRRYVPPRPRLELLAEFLGLLAFILLFPADIALAIRPFFSLDRGEETSGVLVLAACLALYGLPLIRRALFRRSLPRILWWATPFFPALLVLLLLITTKHPYLNPLNPEHHRLAAERIVAISQLGNNVVAAGHVDWIFRYAHDLEARGDAAQAAGWYERGLQLAPDRADARLRLTALRPAASPEAGPAIDTYAPLWPHDITFPEVPRCKIDSALHVDACTIVIVSLGDIPEVLIAALAYSIHRELGLPVLAADAPLPAPTASRNHGLLVGDQWNTSDLDDTFRHAYAFPAAPIKYLLVTDHDIYADGTNYVFSASFSWGAVLSAARFVGLSPDDTPLIVARTTKQALCALIKSFGVPASSDRACVTSYVRGPDEFDRKGNRPTAETLALLRAAIIDCNHTWPELPSAVHPEGYLEDLHQQLEQLAAPPK
jgi:hypothetical protein